MELASLIISVVALMVAVIELAITIGDRKDR